MAHLTNFNGIYSIQSNINRVPYVTANKENSITLTKARWLGGYEEESVKLLLRPKYRQSDNIQAWVVYKVFNSLDVC